MDVKSNELCSTCVLTFSAEALKLKISIDKIATKQRLRH